MISASSSTASSAPATSAKVTFGMSGDISLALLLPKLITFPPPPCIRFMMNNQRPINSTNGSTLISSDINDEPPVSAPVMVMASLFAS